MPEIEIEINTDIGEMETGIKGINGPSCEKTRDYHVQSQVRRQIKGK